MDHSRMHKPRGLLLALSIVLLGAFLVMAPSASAAADDRGQRVQRFLFLGTDPSRDGTPATVVASGPIHAKGTDTVLSDTKDRIAFPKGTISLTHHPKTSGDSFDPVTCLFRFRERGTYKIIGGTGAYQGASGRGRYSVHALGVGCDENAPPKVFMLRIFAKGSIHL